MYTKTIIAALVISAAAVSPSLAGSMAHPKVAQMRIFDANSGKKIFDDGKLDGRACAVGRVATFNPRTGQFSTHQSAKCNF